MALHVRVQSCLITAGLPEKGLVMKNIIKPKDVITTDKKKEIADKLEEEYSKIEMALSEIDAADQKEDECELSPIQELTRRIMFHLSDVVGRSFREMAEGKDPRLVMQIMVRMRECECDTAVKMLQSAFYITGNLKAAEELDIVDICAEFDSDAYAVFIDELITVDMIDWNLKEVFLWVEHEEPCVSAVLS